jgi:uncharacterized protein (UPF0332 family)
MKPEAFLAVAKDLANGSREADWRSAVSRAYYAAFHASLTAINNCGVRFGKSSAAHEKLAICLQHAGSSQVTTAGMQLGSLRTARNEADYDLHSRLFQSAHTPAIQISVAEQVVAATAAIQGNDTITKAVRDYAQNILGLIVLPESGNS